MPLRCRPRQRALRTAVPRASSRIWHLWILILSLWLLVVRGMTDRQIEGLRRVIFHQYLSLAQASNIFLQRSETREIFYHGYDNYMKHAFPEDELRPISCKPLFRDTSNPAHFELNDVLGNYSLTLIDSLSTLAILASSPQNLKGRNRALEDFQRGVAALVEQYGDGTSKRGGQGLRARGFDIDSKVQVFETVIRGLGGLLSGHLFAVGDLPIRGYDPPIEERRAAKALHKGRGRKSLRGIRWRKGFTYDGQLLRLAHDLGRRLLPAFYSPTGLPYPRVNLRHGIPFYPNSAFNHDAENGQCGTAQQPPGEVTETCSAGAGSLVLELTTLSRLTGDHRFEHAAKRAFWAVWNRRSSVGLIGSGIDAESGLWVGPYTGVLVLLLLGPVLRDLLTCLGHQDWSRYRQLLRVRSKVPRSPFWSCCSKRIDFE